MPQLRSSEVNYVAYYLSDLIMIFMFLRIYGLIRHWERYHEFTDLYSKEVCRSHGFTSGRMFTMKCELFYNSVIYINVLFLFSVIILSFILRVFELPYEQNKAKANTDLTDFPSAIWLTVITLTTVGYGDICPQTIGGQITCCVIALWGSFVVSLLVMVTCEIFEFDEQERQAVFHIKLRTAAGKTIMHALKFFLRKRQYYLQRLKMDIDFDRKSTFMKLIKKFSLQIEIKKNYKSKK